jgi:MFS family permease
MLAGGLLTHLAGWRWMMLVNVPIALGVLLPTPAVIPATGRAARRPRLDLAGAATITVGLTALLYAAEQASQAGWAAPATLTPLTIAAALLCGFVAIERRVRAPLLPPAFFGARTVRVANLAMLLKSTVGLAGLFIPTLYFQQVLGYSPLASGLAFLPSGLAALAAGLTGPRLIGRLGGPRPLILLGLGSQLAGLLLMTALPTDGRWTLLLLGLLAVGAGFLWADVGLTISATADLTEHIRGLGAGVLRTAGQLGGALGLGVIAAIITARAHADGDPAGTPEALVAGLQAGLWCGAALAAAALLLVLSGLPKQWPLRDPPTDRA